MQQTHVTINELAEQLDVSGRTIHRDLKSVEQIIHPIQLTLNKKSGIGIHLEGTDEAKEKLELILGNVKHTDYTPEERQAFIFSALLDTNEPIKLFTLASELNVTIATVSNDLDKISGLMDEYKLTLIRKRGYGVKVEGKEENKRSALSYLISQHIDEYDFITLLKENIQNKAKQQFDTISNRLLGLVDHNKLVTLEKCVNRMREKLPYELADSAYIGLVVHLALAMERLQQGENIKFDPTYMKELRHTEEFKLAHEMIKELEEVLAIHIPEDEVGYITMHLMGSKLRYDHDYLLEESVLDLAYKARELIQYVSVELNEDLSENAQLLNDLVAHLKPTMYRLKQEMKIKNPLLKEIEQDYQQLFEVISEGIQSVFPEIKFPNEEIGYLALHFAAAILHVEKGTELNALVLCSSGIGTSKMLASRLIQHIPEIHKVDNRSLFELDALNTEDYDIVISTIPLQDVNQNYILVSPMLTKQEVHQINQHIRKLMINSKLEKTKYEKNKVDGKGNVLERMQYMQNYSKVIVDILTGLKVNIVEQKLPKDNVLRQACLQLENQQVIANKETVFTQLINREQLGGFAIPGTSLALFHTRSDQIKKASFTIYALKHPIELQGMDGKDTQVENLLFMLAPLELSNEGMEVLSHISGLIIKDEKSTSIFQSKNEQQINQFLSTRLNEFINEKLK